jgi:hypothetical protein
MWRFPALRKCLPATFPYGVSRAKLWHANCIEQTERRESAKVESKSVTRKETHMNKFVAIASSIVLASGIAFAGEGTDSKKFEDLDANQDGVITQSEAAAYQDLVAVFNEVDANADGYLTPSEFDSMKEETEDAE